MANVFEVLGKLRKVRANGQSSWLACCPAHNDKNPSLSVTEADGGRVLLKCFAGCTTEDVVGAIGLKMADLMGNDKDREDRGERPTRVKEPKGKPFSLAALKPGHSWNLRKRQHEFVEWYDYRDEDGAILYRKLRFKDAETGAKTFIQCVPTEGGLWTFGRSSHGVKEVLYRLPETLKAIEDGEPVLIVEGERDVETARRIGFAATCNSDGAGKWDPGFADLLKDCSRVVIIADNDPSEAEAKKGNPSAKEWWQGQRHATDIADSLEALGIPWTALTLPVVDGFHVKDLSEWASVAGKDEDYTSGRLRALLMEAFADASPWPSDTYRRPLREEPSASAHSNPAQADAAQKPSPAQPPDAQIKDAAGGMPSPSTRDQSVSLPPVSPNMKSEKNVRGAGEVEDESEICVAFLRKRLIEAMTEKELTPLQKKRSMSKVVCEWLGKRGRFFYDLDDKGHGTAMWFDAVEKKLHRVRQDYFRSWLSRCTAFSREFKDYKMFISAVEDEALIGDATQGIRPKRFWHRERDSIYLSCGEGRMARITAERVSMVDNGTDGVVFEQGYVLNPWDLLEEAQGRDPFDSCGVFSGISTVDGRGPMLVRLWFCGMFGVTGWKPLLVLSGAVGSGKTRVAVAMFQLLGIMSRVTAIDAMGNVKDFWTSVDKGGLFCLDNADHHITWLPDALSVISTGGTFEKKKLYTDTETITQQANCWAVVTSANPSFASDAGLSDRLITVNLERVERDTAESVLTREIEANRCSGLTWLCHIMRKALADVEPVPKGMNRRHPDWAQWVYKLGKAAGKAEGAEKAIRENEGYKALFSVANDAFGRFLLAAMKQQKKEFRGTADELSQLLALTCEGFSTDTWTIMKMGKALSRLSVSLKSLFKFEKLSHSNKAVYVFQPYTPTLDEPSVLTQSSLDDVRDVRGISAKSPIYINSCDFIPNCPNTPNIPPHNNFVSESVNVEEIAVEDTNEWEVL